MPSSVGSNERTAAWAEANAELSAVVAREQDARAELETASRLKDEFLMTISHELRTPLNTIHGWVRMLQTGAVPEAQQARAFDIIERNTRAQTRIVEDLLDVSRIITGKLQLNVRRVDLQAVVQAGIESIRPAAAAKGIELESHVGAGPFVVTGDADRLQQVVWNFLSNALKFTPARGRVSVTLDRLRGRCTRVGGRQRNRDRAGVPAFRLRPIPARGHRHHTRARRPGPGACHRAAISSNCTAAASKSRVPGSIRARTFRVLLPPVTSAALRSARGQRGAAGRA